MAKETVLPPKFQKLSNAWVAAEYLRSVRRFFLGKGNVHEKLARAIASMPYSWTLYYLNHRSVRGLAVKKGKESGRGVGKVARFAIDKILESATGMPRDKQIIPIKGDLSYLRNDNLFPINYGRRTKRSPTC